MIEITQCLVCGGVEFEERFPAVFEGAWKDAAPFFLTNRIKAVNGRIVSCRQCGFMLTSPQFTPAEYAKIYEHAPSGIEHNNSQIGAAARNRKRKGKVLHHLKKGKFLDLGSADGGFVFQMDGFDGTGFDVRDIAKAEPDRGQKILVGSFLKYVGERNPGEDNFDFITAWDVIEHLPELDDYMAAIHKLLKADGLLFCSLPDISSVAARIGGKKWNCLLLEHLWYFTPETFRRYVGKFGFDVMETSSFAYPVELKTLFQRIKQTYGIATFKLPGFLNDLTVSLPMGLMFVVLRKRTV